MNRKYLPLNQPWEFFISLKGYCRSVQRVEGSGGTKNRPKKEGGTPTPSGVLVGDRQEWPRSVGTMTIIRRSPPGVRTSAEEGRLELLWTRTKRGHIGLLGSWCGDGDSPHPWVRASGNSTQEISSEMKLRQVTNRTLSYTKRTGRLK